MNCDGGDEISESFTYACLDERRHVVLEHVFSSDRPDEALTNTNGKVAG
jgi:hypothetical protein